MKKTVCDRCGAEFVGRNASGFHDIIVNSNVYVDLCEDCHEEYYNMKKNFYKNMDNVFNDMVLKFLEK